VEIVDEPRSGHLPTGIRLGEHVPILMAAIESAATCLLTGDRELFGAYLTRSLKALIFSAPRSVFRDTGNEPD
jgi:hypothetical protein